MSANKWILRPTINGKRPRMYFRTRQEAREWLSARPFIKAKPFKAA